MKTRPTNEQNLTFKIDFYRASMKRKWDEPAHLFTKVKSFLAKS